MPVRLLLVTTILVAAITSGAAAEDDPRPAPRQAMSDAWWTGSMLAPSAATLPRGDVLVEPYFYDVVVRTRFDADGRRTPVRGTDGFGSLTYALYGVTDRFTVGLIPTAGYNTAAGSPSSSGFGIGDLTVHAEYGLTRFREGHRMPATALVVQESLPTGRYDRLGNRPDDGFGSGAHTTTVALFSQMYFWLPNGRILRMRLDVSQGFPSGAAVHGVSVYGTGSGFEGRARPGGYVYADASWEYSVTKRWVLSLDATFRRDGRTRIAGWDEADAATPRAVWMDSGVSRAVGFAPAIEYSWNANVGVLVGVRVIAAGRNTAASVTPAVAINIFR
jgi:hypothetical protein